MRRPFGGGIAGWAMTPGASSYAYVAPGAEVRAFNAPQGGLRITDLSLDQAGVNVVGAVFADEHGQIPVFYGPDGVDEMWLSANSGPRVKANPSDGGVLLDAAAATLTATTSALDALEDTKGEDSGIATLNSGGTLTSGQAPPYSIQGSDDINADNATDGDMLVKSGGAWVLSQSAANPYPTEWAALPLLSGNSPGSSIPAYRLIDPTTVKLRGVINKNSGGYDYGNTVANLPAEIIPQAPVAWYLRAACAGNRVMNVGVLNSGQMAVYPYTTTSTWVSLDGLIYDAHYGSTSGAGTFTKSWTATWSNSYGENHAPRGGNLCYQGYAQGLDGWGNQRSLFGFDSAAIRAEIEGATMVKIVLSMYFPHWWNSAGGTAIIGTHNFTSMPSTWDKSRVNYQRWNSSNWPRHAWRNVTLPTAVAGEFANGTTCGFGLGPAYHNTTEYYGYAYGAYDAAKPYITITYTK